LIDQYLGNVGSGVAIILVLVVIVPAWYAGMWWRHNTLAWQNHKVQAGRSRDARKSKFQSLGKVFVSSAILLGAAAIAILAAYGAYGSPKKSQPTHPTTPAATQPASVNHR
jgi:hypothetical protein